MCVYKYDKYVDTGKIIYLFTAEIVILLCKLVSLYTFSSTYIVYMYIHTYILTIVIQYSPVC